MLAPFKTVGKGITLVMRKGAGHLVNQDYATFNVQGRWALS